MKTLKIVLSAVLAVAMVGFGAVGVYAANRHGIPTSGGERNVVWAEIAFNENYVVLGLSAQETLGRPTGTLSEFAAAMADVAGEDVIIFPANFFHAYGGAQANAVIGGIFSDGRVVVDGYFDRGAGFNAANEFSFFNGRVLNDRLYDWGWPNRRFDFVTAFNTYPHLIENGQRLAIEPMPGVTQAWLGGRVFRAFMGQRADGSFVVGNITGANMLETQDVAAHLGLINATNIDGGASAGIWRNGEYITRPGRQLASVVYITNQPVNNEIGVYVNGTRIAFDAPPVIVNERTLVPVRAIFEALGMTVEWCGETRTAAATGTTVTLRIEITIDSTTAYLNGVGVELDVPAMLYNDRTMVPVRFIAESTGAAVDWNDETRSVIITQSSAQAVNTESAENISTAEKTENTENAANIRPREQVRIPVLAYHSVMTREFYEPINADNPWILYIGTFYEQMEYLYENGFTPITTEQLENFLFNNGELPERPVMLTFDDGYLDNALFAAPVLRRFGFTAVQFLITQNIPQTTRQMVAWPAQFMSETEILAATDVFEFGSHSHAMHRAVNGAPLLTTETAAAIKQDILRSFTYPLTFTTGFAYPFGEHSPNALQALTQAGVTFAFTTAEGYLTAQTNPLLIPRFQVTGGPNGWCAEHFSNVVNGFKKP